MNICKLSLYLGLALCSAYTIYARGLVPNMSRADRGHYQPADLGPIIVLASTWYDFSANTYTGSPAYLEFPDGVATQGNSFYYTSGEGWYAIGENQRLIITNLALTAGIYRVTTVVRKIGNDSALSQAGSWILFPGPVTCAVTTVDRDLHTYVHIFTNGAITTNYSYKAFLYTPKLAIRSTLIESIMYR